MSEHLELKIGVIGSRSVKEKRLVYAVLDTIFKKYPNAVLVSGGCEYGPDDFAYDYCIDFGYDIIVCGAGWKRHGKVGAFIRNQRIAKRADIVIAFWDDNSRGTFDTMKKAKNEGKRVYKYDFETNRLVAC